MFVHILSASPDEFKLGGLTETENKDPEKDNNNEGIKQEINENESAMLDN
jgi:hypothetical protein